MTTYTYTAPVNYTVTKESSFSAKKKAVLHFLKSIKSPDDKLEDFQPRHCSTEAKLRVLLYEYGIRYGLNYESSFNELARWKWYDLLQILEG